jgi:ATP-binding cassette subfamily F protein uup
VGGSIDAGETLVVGHYEQTGLVDVPEEQRVVGLVKEAVAQAPGGGTSAEADEKVGRSLIARTPHRALCAPSLHTIYCHFAEWFPACIGHSWGQAAAALLSKFLFPPRRWNDRVAKLSGGERRRLQLLQVLARQPNLLMLDEPTNDLDLDTISVLEDFLIDEYAGVLLIVSHDRYFLDKVVDHLFVLPGDGVGEVRASASVCVRTPGSHTASTDSRLASRPHHTHTTPTHWCLGSSAQVLNWQASFTDYVAYQEQQQQQRRLQQKADTKSAVPKPLPKVAAPASGPKPLSNFEREQFGRLEVQMEEISSQRQRLLKQIDGYDPQRNGYTELTEWTEQSEELAAKLEEVELKWLTLADRAEL